MCLLLLRVSAAVRLPFRHGLFVPASKACVIPSASAMAALCCAGLLARLCCCCWQLGVLVTMESVSGTREGWLRRSGYSEGTAAAAAAVPVSRSECDTFVGLTTLSCAVRTSIGPSALSPESLILFTPSACCQNST